MTGDAAADESATDLLEAISFITTFLLIFAGIALVVGAFLIVNTFSILVAQRSRELALLRALGASRRQVTRSVLLEAFVLGVLGSTIGLGLGVLLAMLLRVLFGQFGLDLSGQPLMFSPRTVVAAYAVGIVVTMVAAFLPARRTVADRAGPGLARRHRAARVVGAPTAAAGRGPRRGRRRPARARPVHLGAPRRLVRRRRDPLDAARHELGQPRHQPAVPGARDGPSTPGRFGAVGNLAGQNSLRNPRRTTATASALMIGLALACTMAIVGDSAKASVDKSVADNFVGDYVVSNVFGGEFNTGIADEMAAVDGRRASGAPALPVPHHRRRRRRAGRDRPRDGRRPRARRHQRLGGRLRRRHRHARSARTPTTTVSRSATRSTSRCPRARRAGR